MKILLVLPEIKSTESRGRLFVEWLKFQMNDLSDENLLKYVEYIEVVE